MKLLKLVSAGVVALALTSSTMAQTFFDESITLQGKLIDLGYAGRVYKWSALTTNGKLSASTMSTTSPAKIDIEGNVGIWANSNSDAKLALSNSSILGDVFLRKGGTKSLSGASQILGNFYQGNSYNTILSTAASDALTLATNIASLTSTTNFTSNFSLSSGSIVGSNSSLTITATDTNPVVLDITNFSLSNSTLTLIGSSTSKFILNIDNQFTMSNGSLVTFDGQLDPENVIFRVGTLTNMSGGSEFNGILLAANSSVSMTGGSSIYGELIGKSITMSGGSKIKKPKPPKPSP